MTETIIIAVIGSGALSAFISGLFTIINNRQQKKHGVAKACQLTLYNDIEDLCDKTLERGTISSEELRHLLDMHECYHTDLGGNGYLDTKIGQVKKLNIKD